MENVFSCSMSYSTWYNGTDTDVFHLSNYLCKCTDWSFPLKRPLCFLVSLWAIGSWTAKSVALKWTARSSFKPVCSMIFYGLLAKHFYGYDQQFWRHYAIMWCYFDKIKFDLVNIHKDLSNELLLYMVCLVENFVKILTITFSWSFKVKCPMSKEALCRTTWTWIQ